MKSFKKILLTALAIVLAVALIACGSSSNTNKVLQDAVEEINSDESMHKSLEGLYKVHAEARGDSTIVVVFKAELEELASREVSEFISGDKDVVSGFREAVDEMQKAGVANPKVVLEFQDMDGQLIYTHNFE